MRFARSSRPLTPARAREVLERDQFISPLPWEVQDLVRLATGYAVAFVAVTVAWFGASEESVWNDSQVFWVNLGAGGVAVAGFSTALWVLRARRMIGRKRDLLMPLLRERVDARAPAGTTVVDDPTLIVNSGLVVSAEGMSRYHRPDCSMAKGKDVRTGSPADFEGDGLAPCGVCQPLG